jgi:hypothetical protein
MIALDRRCLRSATPSSLDAPYARFGKLLFELLLFEPGDRAIKGRKTVIQRNST